MRTDLWRGNGDRTLIINLRKAVGELLDKRDGLITHALCIDNKSKESAEKSAARIALLEAEVKACMHAMEATKNEVTKLQQDYATLDAKLQTCDAEKASALTRAYHLYIYIYMYVCLYILIIRGCGCGCI